MLATNLNNADKSMQEFTLLLAGFSLQKGGQDSRPQAPQAQIESIAQFYLMPGELRHAGGIFS
jgi:hypothetical protein